MRELEILNWIDHQPILFCDNDSVIKVCEGRRNLSNRTRHIDIKDHEVIDQVREAKSLLIRFVPSSKQVAGGLTKVLSKPDIRTMRAMLNLAE